MSGHKGLGISQARPSCLYSTAMDEAHIIGHERQRSQLAADLESGNVAHAYLLAGPAHVGKMTVAQWFARELLTCDTPPEERNDAQRRVDHLLHPDILVLDQLWMEDVCEDFDVIAKSSNIPQQHRSKSPKIMKTDVISIDDVRVIQDRLYDTAAGHYRCCLIRSVERMRDEAANAFLKILEEPPPGRVFLLTTQAMQRLLPTVVSRTRVLQFRPVPKRAMGGIVAGLPAEDAAFILHVAQGAPGMAITLKHDPEALRARKLLHTQAAGFWSSPSLDERMHLLTPLFDRGVEAEAFLLHLSLALREQPKRVPAQALSLTRLVRGLQTNAHRQLLAQRFAMEVD